MVLAALSDNFSEEQLTAQLGSYEFGTPASRVTRLRRWGYRVEFGPATIDDLQTQLELGWHPIVFVRADFLPWADFGGSHALVVGEVTGDTVYVFDPALDGGPTALSLDELLLVWEEFDCLSAVISK
jgi:ABC-type bacteriocin/lantibiotic exporter with double-glycine peptidase domain